MRETLDTYSAPALEIGVQGSEICEWVLVEAGEVRKSDLSSALRLLFPLFLCSLTQTSHNQ